MTRGYVQLLSITLLVVAFSVTLAAQQESIDELRAEAGDADAQYNLGGMYDTGLGVAQDKAEAVRWHRLAADQRNVGSQFSLGTIYADGRGVPQDDVQAHMWFNLSASRATGIVGSEAVRSRDEVANRLTPDQRAEAQRLAREWDEAHPREP